MSRPLASSKPDEDGFVWHGADGDRLVGSRRGRVGQPVLLLHGGGQTRHAWTAISRRLAEAGLDAIAVDQRGHGESDWVATGAYSFFDFGRDAATLAGRIAGETGRKPVLVGASLGGIAGLLASDGASPFAAIVLVDVTPDLNPEGIARIRSFMGDRMEEGFATVEEAGDAVARYLPGRKAPPSPAGLRRNLRLCDDGRWRWHWDPAFLSPVSGAGYRRTEAADRMAAALGMLDIPVLLVRGQQSDIVTADEIAAFRKRAPAAEFVDIAGAGHMVAGDRNDVFGDAILGFLHRHGFFGRL